MPKETSGDSLDAMMKYERGVDALKKPFEEHKKQRESQIKAIKANGGHKQGMNYYNKVEKLTNTT